MKLRGIKLSARKKIVFIILIGAVLISVGIFVQYKYKLFSKADVLSGPDFTDVPLTSPNYWFIHAMKVNGVTMGCTTTTYCPTQATTREQMMMFLQRGAKLDTVPFKTADQLTWAVKFNDLGVDRAWSWPSVQAVVDEFGRGKNLLTNAGFESWATSTAPNPWAPASASLTQESTIIKEGKYSLKAKVTTTSSGRKGAAQVIKNLPAGTYQFSAWVKVVSGQAGLFVDWPDSTGGPKVGVTDWRRMAVTYTNSSTKDVIVYLGGLQPFEAYFDDVKFYRTDTLGCGSGNFCPTTNLNRQTMAQWLSWMLGLDTSTFNPADQNTWAANYTDVPTSNPAWKEIQAISAAGITTGCTTTTYCPTQNVTREQMAIFLVRAFGLPLYLPPVITGKLTTNTGAALTNAVITFDEDYIATTDASGNYKLDENMPPGAYELEILQNGQVWIEGTNGIVSVNEGVQTINISGLHPLTDADFPQ